MRQPQNLGFVENVNVAIAATSPADMVLLNSDCVVTDGWFELLREAALSESRIATATALTNAGTIVSVPHRNRPMPRLPNGMTPSRMAEVIRKGSLRLRPDIPTCVGHCVYIRRSAIDLVGAFDTTFSPGYEEEVDFSQRCLLRGLRHVVADDVFVFHHHMGTFGAGEDMAETRRAHHAIIQQRYPYFDEWSAAVASDQDGPLARALAAASRAVRGTTVSIDGRCLTHTWTGTQLVTLGVILGLDIYTDLRVRVLVPHDVGDVASACLAARERVEVMCPDDLHDGVEPSDVVHRPYQVTSLEDFDYLRRLGRRLVLTQLDNIALRNPGYFESFNQWQDYQRLHRAALFAADQVVFISRHAAEDALALDLIDEGRVNVVSPDTEERILPTDGEPRPPAELAQSRDDPFLLCLGTDFRHKNRLFAMRLVKALIDHHGFDGRLVLAGPTVACGSSAGEEAEYVLAHPDLSGRILDVGAVDEAEKLWLLDNALALVYPTTYEGFGLTPFEAADVGTPSLFASHTSLAEILPESAALLVPWDPVGSAKRVAPVLKAGTERDELLRAVRLAGARFTVRRSALGLAEVYEKALRTPAREKLLADAPRVREELLHARAELTELRTVVEDPLNRGLVGPHAILPPELRRAVLAIAARPGLLKTAHTAYRMGRALRRLGTARNGKTA